MDRVRSSQNLDIAHKQSGVAAVLFTIYFVMLREKNSEGGGWG